MRKYLFLLLFVFGYALQAQYSINGTIDPDHDYSWILLYKLENGEQTYIANADVEDGEFKFEIDEKEDSGIYRAYYQIENNLYVEFIYNKEDVKFSFDPNNPDTSISFSESEENNIYHNYYEAIKSKQQRLDSIQVLYFKSTDKKTDEALEKTYKKYLADLKDEQHLFEKNSEGLLANHFILASSQYNENSPHKEPEAYLEAIKEHFFDAMDLSDSILNHSTFVNDRLNDYVFYLNQGEDEVSENELQKVAIEKAVNWIDHHFETLSSFEEELIETYLISENVEMINFVMDTYYKALPVAYQNEELIRRTEATLLTALGSIAPDFSWESDGKTNTLHSLSGTDYFIVLFFSSNCPHCQMEIPEFYTFISGIENIKVVAVGLEDNKQSWEIMTKEYSEFVNILDLDKWSSQKVKDYGISAIPTYLVLDAEKKILAKPEDFNELKTMFETR
ncbi:redoxin domain-containing protein [Lutimonas halocynthiae]|uniref:thioredoxin-like domain-containing protein n=1 Tax=Lutimonas halocynthiae TaxID=1446477 RepID=UPI0025B3628F|nr:thioredoxin-like domain-containing protein [Lutimonas halocynthiae]MDN3641598.1 redoxin domain-containing protein [Lutimonas halocynthiae]